MKTNNRINKKKNRMNRQKGSSLVEVLVSMAIISYIVVTILSGISQKKLISQNTGDKNAAVYLAETRVEELLKFPCDQLLEQVQVDYIIFKGYGFQVFKAGDPDPNTLRQFRRTTTVQKDLIGRLATITVRVDYSASIDRSVSASDFVYPFHVELSTRRTIQ